MDLKKVSEIFAVLIPPLILCSCIRLVTYYSHWDIPIFEYLSTTEILFSFIEPGLVMLVLAGLYLVCNFLVLGVVYFIVRFKEKNSGVTKRGNVESKMNEINDGLSAKQKVIFYIIFCCVLFLGIISTIRGIWYDYSVTTTLLTHITVWIFLLLGIKIVFLKKSNDILTPILLATVLTIASASFFYGRFQGHNTLLHPQKRTLFIDNGEIIQTDNNLLYLGRTADYYFLFDNLSKSAEIIPADKIKKDVIKIDSTFHYFNH